MRLRALAALALAGNLGFQHPYGGSHLLVTPVPGNPVPDSGVHWK